MMLCLQFISAVLVNSHNRHNDAFHSLLFTTRQWNLPLFLSRADVLKSRSLQCQFQYRKKKSQGTRSGEHVGSMYRVLVCNKTFCYVSTYQYVTHMLVRISISTYPYCCRPWISGNPYVSMCQYLPEW